MPTAVATIFFHKRQRSKQFRILTTHLSVLLPEVAATELLERFARTAALEVDKRVLSCSRFDAVLTKLAAKPPQSTIEFLTRAVERDFEDGNLVVVDGWTLALTDVRLLVLIAARRM
jgi:hypothetical protein